MRDRLRACVLQRQVTSAAGPGYLELLEQGHDSGEDHLQAKGPGARSQTPAGHADSTRLYQIRVALQMADTENDAGCGDRFRCPDALSRARHRRAAADRRIADSDPDGVDRRLYTFFNVYYTP